MILCAQADSTHLAAWAPIAAFQSRPAAWSCMRVATQSSSETSPIPWQASLQEAHIERHTACCGTALPEGHMERPVAACPPPNKHPNLCNASAYLFVSQPNGVRTTVVH